MNIDVNVFMAIGFLLLSLEHFGVPIPPIVTGIILLLLALAMLL